ncbi:hypothetical protein K8089_00490 [Aequorivita sp. F47161]|uniref:Uncharacterized protein n=1 Tax=Aequorivita vitellina TaxID=2874475 RepID=A0A9X1QVP8_9FLAO|nr:hypothetical protein [Aequorivita vitellina]MCG2417479.1 hypothetical protein [Aequorivita vitellina]
MKHTFLIVAIITGLSVISCKKDEGGSCTTCASPQTADFQVCEKSNGNAAVNGQDTGTAYDVYIQGLVAAGATCGQ